MNILSNYIHQQSTEEEIEQSLEKVCNQLTGILQKQCHELVDNYGPPIIALLIKDFDVSTICRKLNLCTKQMKVELAQSEKANVALCGVCDYLSTYINFALKRDSSEKSVQRAVSTVCSQLSNDQKSQCEKLVQLFRPNIRELKGDNFCKELTFCRTPMKELKPAINLDRVPLKQDAELKEKVLKNLDDTPQCMLCHYVVSYLDAVLKNNKSEAAVQAALAKVCTILPSMINHKEKDFWNSLILFRKRSCTM
jgi:saposin